MKRLLLILSLLALFGLYGLGWAQAHNGSGYDLSWNTIAGGGGESSGGGYALQGTLGQASPGIQGSGSYTLEGGFWVGRRPTFRVYLPSVSRW